MEERSTDASRIKKKKARHSGRGMATERFGPMSQSTEAQCTVEANRQQAVWRHCKTGQTEIMERDPSGEGEGKGMRWEQREGGGEEATFQISASLD
jgi:hypothetical protein